MTSLSQRSDLALFTARQSADMSNSQFMGIVVSSRPARELDRSILIRFYQKRCRQDKGCFAGKTNGVGRKEAPRVGLEPTTLRLTAACSTIELPRKRPANHPMVYHVPSTKAHGETLTYKMVSRPSALVAELVDAQHSGCCAHTGVEVRVLSRALTKKAG